MATIEKLRNDNLIGNEKSFNAMPSRAKYFRSDISGAKPVYKNSAVRDFEYKEDLQNYNNIDIKNEEVKRDLKAGNPDILPTGATLKMLNNQAPEKPFDNSTTVSFKVNSKGKLFFALYTLLVLSLILVIVLNAVNIERQNNANASIQNEIALMNTAIENLSNQSDSLNNNDYIYTQAQSLGMSEINVTHITLNKPQLISNTEIQPVTNWFDWFCDIFS